ncbi:hypothetical protein B0H14DRAFT_2792142 [Mycena olivaceomarginata]|nr:hypothetical protein B0H14DRAFT_2792142 [Mycena olivaceomarginata]
MARVSMPGVWDYIKFCSIYFFLFLSVSLTPVLLERYYPDSVAAFYTLTRGLTALCFCVSIAVFSMLLSADGTAVPPTPTTANTETDAEAPTVGESAFVFSLGPCTYFFVHNAFGNDVVSHDRPVLENLAAAALYILHGFEVLIKEHSDAAVAEPEVAVGAPAAPVEVLLFDDGVVGEKDLLKVEEKA